MFACVKVELVPLTPALAKSFMEMDKLPGERPFKASRVHFFEDHINAGTFRDPRWAVGIRRSDRKQFRLDGQHTSTMLANLTASHFPHGLHVQLSTWEFDSFEDDSAGMFDMFDNPKAARSNEDIMGIFTNQFEEVHALGNKFNVQLTAGIAEYESGIMNGLVYPPRYRGYYFGYKGEYRRFAVWAYTLRRDIAVVNPWIFSKTGLIAEMLSDWKHNPQLAAQFWGFVLNESHPDRDHTTRELAEDLKRWNQKAESRPPHDYRIRSQKAWRRYQKELEFTTPTEAETTTAA